MSLAARLVVLIIPMILTGACARVAPAPAPFTEPMLPGALTANVVFEGTVTLPGDSAMVAEVAGHQSTVTVRVTGVARAPEALGELTGREVVVLAPDVPPPALGERVIVFGQVVAVGRTVAVREILRVDAPLDENLRRRLRQADQRQQDSVLSVRLNQASRVVVGSVASIVDTLRAVRDSEHDPQWQLAIVQVRESLKGDASPEVAVWFPTSRDVMWFRAPRFEAGQEGIWILQRLTTPAGFTALEPGDYRHLTEIGQVQRLMKASF